MLGDSLASHLVCWGTHWQVTWCVGGLIGKSLCVSGGLIGKSLSHWWSPRVLINKINVNCHFAHCASVGDNA